MQNRYLTESSSQARRLFEDTKERIYQYRSEPFLLSSGGESNHYFNCKKITMVPDLLHRLACVFRDEVLPRVGYPEGPPAAGGLTLGSDPIAFALSLAYLEQGRTVYPIVVRKESKGHGTGRQIEGEAELVSEVVLLDDVVTTGGASLKAVHALRSAGLIVRNALCVVDRQEGGYEALKAEGVELHGLFRKSDFPVPG
jgi:orotate phosphoribosyltransferase